MNKNRALRRMPPVLVAGGVLLNLVSAFFFMAAGTNGDLARENYSERTATVAAVSEVPGQPRTVTTADGLTLASGASYASACPAAPAYPGIGESVTISTLNGLGSTPPLSVVGPCEPEAMPQMVGSRAFSGGPWADNSAYAQTLLPETVLRAVFYASFGVTALGFVLLVKLQDVRFGRPRKTYARA